MLTDNIHTHVEIVQKIGHIPIGERRRLPGRGSRHGPRYEMACDCNKYQVTRRPNTVQRSDHWQLLLLLVRLEIMVHRCEK